MGYADPISTNPAMVLGGLERRRHAAGLDLRLLDDRQQRRPGQRHAGAAARRQPRRLHPGHRPGRPHDQGRRQRLDPHAGDPGRRRRRSEEHPRNGGQQRHRHPRQHRRLGPVGQDRHDREQRRRLVLRRHRRRSDRLRLGRLRRHDDADDDPLQRRPGDGRHLPGADLGQRDLGLGEHQGRTGGGSEGRQERLRLVGLDLHAAGIQPKAKKSSPVEPEESEPAEPVAPEEAPEAAEPAEPAPAEPAAPAEGGGVTAG